MRILMCTRCETPMFLNEGATETTCGGCGLLWKTTDGKCFTATTHEDDDRAVDALRCRCGGATLFPEHDAQFQRCPQCLTLFELVGLQWEIDPPLSQELLEYCLSLPNDEETLNSLLDALSTHITPAKEPTP